MITLLLASLVPSALAPILDRAQPPSPMPLALQDAGQSGDPEFDKKLAACGTDVAQLWALHEACAAEGKKDLSKLALKKILEVDPNHEGAHKALQHRLYDGKWFESYSALSKYRRDEEKRMLEEHGKVRYGEGWAKPEDVPYLRMGWAKDERSGRWSDPNEVARLAEEARLKSEGYEQRDDLTWIAPADVDKWKQGLWQCGEEWLDLDKANAYHASVMHPWRLTGAEDRFITMGTIPRAADGRGPLDYARWWANLAYPDLVRALGVEPTEKPSFLVLNSLQQYNTFAAGDQAQGLPATEISGCSSVHYSYFAEAWFLPGVGETPRYNGAGVGYYAVDDPALRPFGQYSVRHAAAHSFMEAIDPSWDTISQAVTNPQALQVQTFWQEKKIPKWLRYGIASYCERFCKDPAPQEGGDPWAFRAWALQNLRAGGELDPLEQIFLMNLDANDPAGSVRRIHEAGLLVSFILDGECQPVKQAHEAFKAALSEGKGTTEAAQALQKALEANLAELKAFAKY